MKRTWVFCLLALLADGVICHGQNCAWNKKIYIDGDLHVNGRVCQVCGAGIWSDRIVSDCSKCVPIHSPQPGNPLPGKNDCVYPSGAGLTYSNGAWIYDGTDDQVCGNTVWLKQKPPQVCQAPDKKPPADQRK